MRFQILKIRMISDILHTNIGVLAITQSSDTSSRYFFSNFADRLTSVTEQSSFNIFQVHRPELKLSQYEIFNFEDPQRFQILKIRMISDISASHVVMPIMNT